tara:strand:- start:2274 stop:2894 length:621 start_codon:yes stop_codon:yes gene_type:complete
VGVPIPDDIDAVAASPTYIWKLKYPFNYEGESLQEHIGMLMDETEQHWGTGSALETGASFSTVYNDKSAPHKWEILEDLIVYLQPKLHAIWHNWGYQPGIPEPIRSWVNVHKRSGRTMEHYHNGAPMVVSCYLKVPEGSGHFEYRDPLEYHRWGTPGEPQIDLWNEVPVETNDILVFPGWLKHRTQVNRVDDDRVCLTLNYALADY